MNVILKHLKTSKVDDQTLKYWFGFVERPRQAFVIYLDLFDADGHKEPFRIQVAGLSNEQYKAFDKRAANGYGYFELPVPSDTRPFVSFIYHARTGILFDKRTQELKAEICSEIEDLTDVKHAMDFLKMIQDSNKNQ